MKKTLLATLLLSGCYLPDTPAPVQPNPPPPPPATVEQATYSSSRDYIERAALAFENLEKRLRIGEFKSQREFADEMERMTRQARVDGYGPMREAWQNANSDPWEPAKDADNCRDTALGFRKVLK